MPKPDETIQDLPHGNITRMELEANEIIEITSNVENIEKDIVPSDIGYTYYPDTFKACFLPQNDLAKEITLITLKVFLVKIKIKSPGSNIKIIGAEEMYIINKDWFEKWKKYTKYGTVGRTIKAASTYIQNPIKYTPNEKLNPGPINNKDLFIKNKLNNNDGRNILISKNNDAYDTKIKIKLITRDRFNLLKDYFKCDMVLKVDDNDHNKYDNFSGFCVHLNVIFIPTIEKIRGVDDNNYENFCKNHNIIYDCYFKQNSGDGIITELKNILKEKPELLSNMGVNFVAENNEEELNNHFKFLKYYIPDKDKNTKSPKEILDFILSKESIEKIKKNEKISSEDITIHNRPSYYLDVYNSFELKFEKKKNNIDEIKNGLILIEYIPCDKSDEEKLYSIFEEDKNPPQFTSPSYSQSDWETCAPRPRSNSGTGHPPSPSNYKKEYKLEDFPLNEKENKNGLVGLNNLGNTCYMNTGIQCLSNCVLLTKYFLEKHYITFINKDNPIGSGGEIVEKYSQLLQHLWYGNREFISPIQFKKAFGKMYQAFNGSRQQDTQEFISYLLDSLHEDLNKVTKKPYVQAKDLEPNLSDQEIFKITKDLYLCRNQSFIADLIYGFYKSTVFCPEPKCKNVIKSFEPFNMVTLSLINEAELRKIEEFKEEQNKKLGIKELTCTFIPFKICSRPICFKVRIKKDMDVFTFKKKIEIITKFNLNTFEIYKQQGNEYLPMKPDMYLMEEFLKGEKKLFLFQIPPYVFGKKLNHFDRIYSKLISDMDSFFLEEEKYEGNDLYKEYNKKEHKAKTEDDLNLTKKTTMQTAMHIEENENGMNIEENKENHNENDEKIKNEININTNINSNNKINNTTDDLKLKSPNILEKKEEEDIEMEDKTLNLDKTDWVKAELYNYTYQLPTGKNKKAKSERISMPRIIYINKNWSNAQLYDCINDILVGAKKEMPEIKQMWYIDLKETTINLDQINKNKEGNIYEQFHKLSTHPLMVQYLRYFNFNKENIIKKGDKKENSIFVYNPEEYKIKEILEEAEKNGNSIDDTEILFKITWKQDFVEEYKEGIKPKILEKSEKLEDILKVQREDEFLKKNNIEKNEKDSKNNKNKKLNLYELLNNFNQIEKLSKDNEWFCPKCKKLQLADKKMEIYSLSEIVIIHLKRFRNNRKIENLVEFPIEGLDLTKYLPKNNKEKYIYDLFAVANHVGGLHGGHYFAYCKNTKEGEWYEFNDTSVSKIEVKKVCSDNAYVLFYSRRRDEKIDEEELFKKPFVEIDISKYKSD